MKTLITHIGIKELVIEAAVGKKELQEISATDDLFEFGYNSISIVNLIELLEDKYGIYLEPEKNIKKLNTIENIYNILMEKSAETYAGGHFF
jgi:acyl carrier protein